MKLHQKGMKIFEKGYVEGLKIKERMKQEFTEDDIIQFISYLKKISQSFKFYC